MKLLAYRLAEKFVFGKKGVDIRFRLLILGDLGRCGVTTDTTEGKALYLSILPLEFGNQFPVIAGWLTVVLALIFALVAPESIRTVMLQTPSEQHLVSLALAWASAYLIASFAAAGIVFAYALIAYGRRGSKLNSIAADLRAHQGWRPSHPIEILAKNVFEAALAGLSSLRTYVVSDGLQDQRYFTIGSELQIYYLSLIFREARVQAGDEPAADLEREISKRCFVHYLEFLGIGDAHEDRVSSEHLLRTVSSERRQLYLGLSENGAPDPSSTLSSLAARLAQVTGHHDVDVVFGAVVESVAGRKGSLVSSELVRGALASLRAVARA